MVYEALGHQQRLSKSLCRFCEALKIGRLASGRGQEGLESSTTIDVDRKEVDVSCSKQLKPSNPPI